MPSGMTMKILGQNFLLFNENTEMMVPLKIYFTVETKLNQRWYISHETETKTKKLF